MDHFHLISTKVRSIRIRTRIHCQSGSVHDDEVDGDVTNAKLALHNKLVGTQKVSIGMIKSKPGIYSVY